MMASSPICLLSKASKTKSWLWHRRLSHLIFGAINHLARHGLVRGLPKLKFKTDHLCSACAMGKSKKKPYKPKSEDTNQEKLYLLHMDLCGPMYVASVNGKKYILVIVDDYSRFTWVKCLRSKDEAPDFIIKFLKMIQVLLKIDQSEEGPTNFALVVYSSTSSNTEVSTDSNCSSSCLKNVKILKEQNKQLLKDLRTSKLNAIAYKTGLESVEARLLVYKKNESNYEEDFKVLKHKIHLREVTITELRRKLELAQKKDEIQLTVENFENSSKNLSKLIDCQIVDKCKTGLGYNAVPPPYTGNFMPSKLDLSFFGLEEFTSEPIVIKLVVENSEAKASEAKPKAVRKNNDAPIIEDWVSESEEEDVPQAKIEKKIVKPSFSKIEFVKPKGKTARKTAKQVEQLRQNSYTPRGNQRN
ncbi:ribonuclease H-like domain-containing protein [Tanacetum coccineum]